MTSLKYNYTIPSSAIYFILTVFHKILDFYEEICYTLSRAPLKTRLIKEKSDRCGSCKETFRKRAVAL